MNLTITSEGLPDLARYLAAAPEIARKSARIALNDTADGAVRKLIPDAIEAQVAFPPGYLDERLVVYDRATDSKLEVSIRARQRATSLARFAPNAVPGAPTGSISVTVKPGHTITLKRAFAVRLRAGSASVQSDFFNVGIAIRLAPGQTIRNKKFFSAVQLEDNVFILYGPSVDQVFATVADDVSPELANEVETEFLRQFLRLSDETK